MKCGSIKPQTHSIDFNIFFFLFSFFKQLFHQEKEILSHQIECHSNVQNPSITKIVQQVQGKTLTGSTAVSHSNVSSPPEILATTGSLKSQAPILSKTKDLSPSQNNTPINSKAQTTPINMMMLPKQPEAMMVQRQESNVVIKNDLTQPVVFVKTPNKVSILFPFCSYYLWCMKLDDEWVTKP